MPDLYEQNTNSLIASQAKNLPSYPISGDPTTENLLDLTQKLPLPSSTSSEVSDIDSVQKLEKLDNSTDFLVTELNYQPFKSYSTSLNQTEKTASVDEEAGNDLLIGKLDNSEFQSLQNEEPGDTLIGTANLPTVQAKDTISLLSIKEAVQLTQITDSIPPTTAAPEENPQKDEVETSIPVTSSVVEETQKTTLHLQSDTTIPPKETPSLTSQADQTKRLTETENKNQTLEQVTDTAISSRETPNSTSQTSQTKTDILSNSAGDGASKTEEQLVTSSNQAEEPQVATPITTQSNSEKSLEEVAKKQPKQENLTISNPSLEVSNKDAGAPSVINVKSEEIENFKSGVFTVGSSGEVGIDFLYDGGWYQGELAIFSLEGMEKYKPGSPDFIKEAALRASSNSELGYIVIEDKNEGARFSGMLVEDNYNQGEYQGVKSFKLSPGSQFGVMLVPNNRVTKLIANPIASGSTRPLFSMATANPNEAFHAGQIADVTGEGNTFVMEDLRMDVWSDRDYNDIIFQVRGATAKAALMSDVVASGKDWRTSDLGKALVAYAKSYINPEFLENEKIDSSIEKAQDSSKNELGITETPEAEPVKPIEEIAVEPATGDQIKPIDDISVKPVEESEVISSQSISDEPVEVGEVIPSQSISDEPVEVGEVISGFQAQQDWGGSASTVSSASQLEAEPQATDSQAEPVNLEDQELEAEPQATGSQTEPVNLESVNLESVKLPIAEVNQLNDSIKLLQSLGIEASKEVLEIAKNSLPTDHSASPSIKEPPNPKTDILTGEKIPTPPAPSIPTLQISQPLSNQEKQPLTGEISATDNKPQNWVPSLVEFVSKVVKSGQQNAVVTLNIDPTKVQTAGSAALTKQLTVEEKAALVYAQENNVLVVVPAGDAAGQISALAQTSKEFDNIITVGAAERVNNAVAVSKAFAPAANSGSGSALDILAEGTDKNASGTAVAATKATLAVSQVWAANPQLNYAQVIDIVKRTATDLGKPNWDAATGAGMVNVEAAVWLAKATEPLPKLPAQPAIYVAPVADITLTPEQVSTNLDLSKVFAGKGLTYEVIAGNSDAVALQLSGTQLQLTGLEKSGMTDVTIRALDVTGKSADAKFSVTNYYLDKPSISEINTALNQLTNAIAGNTEGLITALSSDETEAPFDVIFSSLEQNPELIQLLAKPETLSKFGFDSAGLATIQQLLQSQELAQELGLSVPVGEALSKPDSTLLDTFLLNADEAVSLLPDNAKQPQVGFIDFTQGNHIQQVTNIFASVNPVAKYDTFNVTGGDWASQLMKFVDKVKSSGEERAIVNLSFDLSQLDDIGITTRYELTPEEQQAIQYARENNVLLVVASGNTGGVMSALGAASKRFDNIITVGAVNQFESKTDYSGYGEGLTLMAPGGSWHDDSKAFVGTSRATAYVTAAASLIWAANPALSFQQVKQLLIDTAADLDVEGWDALTGAGLVDVKEAIDRATLIEAEGVITEGLPLQVNPFSGEWRVKTLARAASEQTEKAITSLENTQETLLEQWQILADLGNPLLNLSDLEAQVKDKIAVAFETYQQVSTDAAITTAQAQQWAEALALATQHYHIEQARLQALQARQKELEEQLTGLGQQKTALEAETQKLLDGIKEQIAKAESDLAKSQAKLSNPFANVDDNLQTDSQPWRNAAESQQQLAQNFRQQADALAAESQNYQAAANGINPYRWQVVGSQPRPSGRRKEVWGWGENSQLVQQKNQYQWLANITAQNSQILQQLAAQTDQQVAALNQYGQFLEDRKNSLVLGSGSTNDAAEVLELLQQQAAQQQALANNYLQQASIAEQRRQQSQSNADWHNSQINRWEVVGTKRGKSGKTEDVWGWRHYPEHIAPRDRAQQLANEANAERQTYAQLAQQAQQQANALAEQARKLQERLRDWPVLKQGIEYEIAADSLRLQAEKDLLAMHEPVQEQKLETLNLQISQTEAELQRLTGEKLPTQQQLTDATEQRLQETQSEVEAIQQQRESAQKDLQNFLETAGFLLPYRERLAAVEKTIQQLEDDTLKIQETMQQLAIALLQTPSEPLRQQLTHWSNYVETLNQELAWANLQKDQLALALADSPERLAISGLIKELDGIKGTAVADDVPAQQYVDFLHGIEGSGANFLEGFDNLEQRLAAAKTEQDNAELALKQLQEEYRNLGLQKANLEDNLIPAKEQEIKATQADIVATETTLANLQTELTGLQDDQAQKAVEVANQEAVVAATQAQTQAEIANIQNQINAKDAQIQQQQLDGLNNLLPQQQQQLADLQAQLPLLEQQLIDKYRAIELTEKYLSQVEAEVNRLDARLDLLNRAGFLEQKYQDNWQQWQQATQQQTQATEALIATRKAGENDRALLVSLQSQLTQAQTNLQTAQTLQQSIADTQQAVEFSKLQLGNQHLLLQSLIDRENSLAALERYYLNLSEASRQQIWSGGKYNAAEAAAYRSYLEQASFVADLRNKGWQDRQQTEKRINELNQQIIQQQSQIATQQWQLATLGGIAQLQAQVASLNAVIATVNKRLEPLQILERQQTEAIANAGTLTQNLTSELVQTAQLQSNALRQLIGFGILASESDVDFFLTQVEPKVNSAIEKLRQRQQELTAQVESAASLTASAEQQLANTNDEVSKQALTNLINQLEAQQNNLEELKAQNQNTADELEDLLQQANNSLIPLRQKQELEIRQKLESNDGRLQALQSQLNSENAAENAVKADTVLAYAQLNDQIRQDLTLNAGNWTQQLLAGHQMTKELGASQQNLSASVDELITYIQENFAGSHGEYNRSEANLRDGITTLNVVENRADELDSAFTSTEDAIERIKLRLAQDAALWEKIAPIAIRYGIESQQLAEFTQLVQKLQAAKEKFDKQQPDAIAFATQEILPVARSFVDKANTKPQLAPIVEKIKSLLANFDDLAAKQAASEAKAAEARQLWEEALQKEQQKTELTPNPVNRVEFKGQLIEAVQGNDNFAYIRNSADGGKTWTSWQQLHDSQNGVKFVVANNALNVIVKGLDNSAWINSTWDGINWGFWTRPTEPSNGDISVDAINEKIVFVWKGLDNKLQRSTIIPFVPFYESDSSLATTISRVVQEAVDDKLLQAYQGVDNRIYIRSTTDGSNWQSWETLESAFAKAEIKPEVLQELKQKATRTVNPVTRIEYKGKLVEALRGEDKAIYLRHSTDGGQTWSNWEHNAGYLNSDVKMVVADNTLIQVSQGIDNIIVFRQSLDGVNWSPWGGISSPVPNGFLVDVIDNKVVLSTRGADNKFYTRTLIPNVRWTDWQAAPVDVLNGVSQEIVDGKVVQTYQGSDGQIYNRFTSDAINWSAWENHEAIAKQYQQQKEALLQPITQETSFAAHPFFLADNSENGTAIDLLIAVTRDGSNPQWQISQQLNAPNADTLLNAPAVEGRNPLQALFDKSQAEQASHEAQGHALLAQAAWYEKQAAYHWAVSHKNGPTWTEWRRVCKRRPLRRKKCWDEAVTHVDYDWIIWQQYSQIFPQLRQQGYAHLVEADKWRKEKERLEPLKNQWIEANDAANEANPAVKETRNFFAQLEAARSDIPQAETLLKSLETLLPTLKEQLEQAEAEAAAQNAKVQQQWEDYDTDSEEYRAAIADILQRRGELNKQAIETQQQIAESEKWVERQSVALSEELTSVKALIDSLQQQRQNIANEIVDLVKKGVSVDGLDDLYTKDAQLAQSLQMLTNKATVLTAQQTALTQKRTLLTAQNEVILAEQQLLDAYIKDPDADTSNLEQQLLDARAALAEAQRLAEQAEAASKALTASLQEIKTDLLAQNDEHLKAAKEHQVILKQLLEVTQLNANYTLQALQKQQEVNNLEFQILQRLQEATKAGYGEAKALLDVAQHNDMATAAEIYYRDYKDLASDKGNSCTGRFDVGEYTRLADRYYGEMLANRELQRRAQAQADAFRVAKETAQAQMNVLQQQQATAQQLLNELNAKVAETQEEQEKKQQELVIAQARLDGITRIREQTEQTFTQLVTLEKLNLAQAQLEQEIAHNRQTDIDVAVQARMERDRLELERKRLETQARIEQLRQLLAEDDLRQNLNEVRGNLGLATLEAMDDPAQLQSQLAGLLTSLKDLRTQQPELPENVKALLAEAQGDIHLALQGKEAANIQQNLLNAMDGLIEQIQAYKTEINRIDLEEQWDNDLLQTAQSDLQGASQQLLKELERSAELQGEHDVIDPLYMEALNKIALAEQAVDISEDMTKQGKEMLEQIIKQRIQERKARKKSFWQKVLGIISQVAGILSTILTILSPTFPVLAPFAIGLGAVSGAISTIQAALNGDWLGAIFNGVMTGLTAITGGMTSVLGESAKAVQMMKTLQTVASGAFAKARSLMSADSIMGFLQILGSVASAASAGMANLINQYSGTLKNVMLSVVQSLQQAPQMIYGGIKAIQNGDWLIAISNFFNGAMAIGQSFAGNFNKAVAGILENVSKVSNTALYLGNAIKDGGIEGWLSGLNGILALWKDDLSNLVKDIKDNDNVVHLDEEDKTDDLLEEDKNEDILEDSIDEDSLSGSSTPVPEGYNLSPELVSWLQKHPGYLVAGELSDEQFWTILDGQERNQQPETVLTGEVTSGSPNIENSVNIRLKIFIPSEAVSDPFAAYSGDDRTFSYESNRYRSLQDINIDLSQGKSEDLLLDQKQEWGESKIYAFWEVENTKTPADPDWFKSLKDGATVDERNRLTRNDDNLNFTVNRINKDTVRVTFKVKGKNPVAAFGLVTPSIDTNISLDISRSNTGSLYYTLQGAHDGFPAYELYLNGQPVYQYDPAKHGKTPLDLFGNGNVKIKNQEPHILEK